MDDRLNITPTGDVYPYLGRAQPARSEKQGEGKKINWWDDNDDGEKWIHMLELPNRKYIHRATTLLSSTQLYAAIISINYCSYSS